MKKAVIGILAHVDAGKTTLSEGLLYLSGKIKKLGRVDHRDSYLDNYMLERERGITIFSKQAEFTAGELEVTLLDTPGHMDFSTEAERTMQVLDYAILVISGTDGVQAHTETLWRLLKRYNVPVFIFINKMDLPGCDREKLMADIKKHLDGACMDFSAFPAEELALCSEKALEKYTRTGKLENGDVAELIAARLAFPCFFGSALKLEGVEKFLKGLEDCMLRKEYPTEFGAKVFKIARDAEGNRMTYMKITGGSLKLRSMLGYAHKDGMTEEKVTQIRVYSGAKYENVEEATAGGVYAVLGLSSTRSGQGLGTEKESASPVLESVMSYRILLPEGCDVRTALPKLQQLEEEDPQLHIVWNERYHEIHMQLMGEVQIQVIQSIIEERYGIPVKVDSGRISYRETIAESVEGVGHFEPLRHYAEVHLLLEPLERGSGLEFDANCGEDMLDRNWQRLILTHLEEKVHLGVLTGSPVTDMRITLVAGRAHIKHTEGGDFRQATYRAVRQGLMKAQSILLEPWYEFRLEIPPEQTGRAINDLRAMSGSFSAPEDADGMTVLRGRAPVSKMNGYSALVAAYTRGRGRLICSEGGYDRCHNEKEVIDAAEYDPERDEENTADSVFCAHGAGFIVKWNRVSEYMHVDSGVLQCPKPDYEPTARLYAHNFNIDEKELEEIMEREFGPVKRRQYAAPASVTPEREIVPPRTEYLIVDGYNMIFAWDELKKLARDDLDAARHRLMDLLCGYRSFKNSELVLVFDGYKVRGNSGEKFDYHGIHVVYTKEGQTGDMYIEKLANSIGKNYSVRVATSDNLIQISALRSGILRVSSRELADEVTAVGKRIESLIEELNQRNL